MAKREASPIDDILTEIASPRRAVKCFTCADPKFAPMIRDLLERIAAEPEKHLAVTPYSLFHALQKRGYAVKQSTSLAKHIREHEAELWQRVEEARDALRR